VFAVLFVCMGPSNIRKTNNNNNAHSQSFQPSKAINTAEYVFRKTFFSQSIQYNVLATAISTAVPITFGATLLVSVVPVPPCWNAAATGAAKGAAAARDAPRGPGMPRHHGRHHRGQLRRVSGLAAVLVIWWRRRGTVEGGAPVRTGGPGTAPNAVWRLPGAGQGGRLPGRAPPAPRRRAARLRERSARPPRRRRRQ
jgi:hypothetical protein